jgi:xanthine/CO dehydrogenase XdhC/CoxF family maturation factor
LHLGTRALLKFFQAHRDDESLVLVSITATEGSTYRKPGAMMLISLDNSYEGMISGGCLEGDLLHHAAEVFSSGVPKTITYDMHAGDELVWGLGLGCDGIIHLMLQRLDRDGGFALLDFIEQSLLSRIPVLLAQVTDSGRADLPTAAAGLFNLAGHSLGDERLVRECAVLCQADWPEWRHKLLMRDDHTLMLINIQPPPRILLCGAGPDAVPVAGQASRLGWDCIVADHRPAFVRAERFPSECSLVLSRPEALHEQLDFSKVDAAVIMSHHLDNDAQYLRQLTQQPEKPALRYIGVLGPAARRDRLREMADCPRQLVYGPVGLDIGAELPESIALAILAEIHAVLNHRDGQSLTTGPVGSQD